VTHGAAAPSGWDRSNRALGDAGLLGEAKGGERGEKAKKATSAFPVLCSACET